VTSEREIIERSLYEVKLFLKVRNSDNWTQSLYQYANRFAHLYLLRELNGIPAFLVFASFVDDQEMHGLSLYVIDLFVDINQITVASKPTL
jgi:hypothetical protein